MCSPKIYFHTQNRITIGNKILYFLCLPASPISIQNKYCLEFMVRFLSFFAQNIDKSQELL